ncbi:MAG TPA: hypothetical protein VMB85_23610 [Bryobacteraceae bacterium]|jgi:hypothetical protein|nr:hypothetical protein [Bryobacteraceae bacterium]
MIEKHSLHSLGAIQARLKYLKEKKAVLDELINSLERYSAYRNLERVPSNRAGTRRRLAGVA